MSASEHLAGDRVKVAAATLIVTLTVGLIAAATTEHAHAAKATKSKTKTVTVTDTVSSSEEVKAIVASCPKGYKAVGGGAQPSPAPFVDPNSFGTYLVASERLDTRSWQSTVKLSDTQFASDPATYTIVAQAFCRNKLKGSITEVEATQSIPPGGQTSATASCPGNKSLISGGFRTTGLISNGMGATIGGASPSESRRVSPLTWQATAFSFGVSEVVTATAYCLGGKKKDRPKLTELVSAAQPIGATGDVKTVTTSSCARKRPLINGGFSAVEPGNEEGAEYGSYSSSPGVWAASAQQFIGSNSPLVAYAYCLKR